ncbi:MAG: lysophospholipid acyltransferase family protein [Tepidisphaeraceae bacterium]
MNRRSAKEQRSGEFDRVFVAALRAAGRCFARVYHQLEVRSPCRLPRTGAAILVSNHTSALDPFLIQSVCPRLIVWMMAREYYEIPSLGWLFKGVQAIPVDRGGRDLTATRAALRALSDGRVVGIFPEGRIESSRDLLPFHAGVAMISTHAGVPIYPAYLDGTQRGKDTVQSVLQSQRGSVSFGPAVPWNPSPGIRRPDLSMLTEQIRQSVQELARSR